jgi:hypothetical protein
MSAYSNRVKDELCHPISPFFKCKASTDRLSFNIGS